MQTLLATLIATATSLTPLSKSTYQHVIATDDAIRVGLLHCARPSWEDDSVSWLLGGGYSVSSLVPRLAPKPTAILWGRQVRASCRRRPDGL